MAPFDFKLENHFVGSSDGTSLQVYELTKSSAAFSSIHKADWKKVATINPQPDDDVVGVDGGHACDGLRFFDGDERIEEPEMLTMLAQHLNQLRLLASPEGYCFQKVSDFGVHYLRLNDLFSWPLYGVKLVTVNTTWSRLEIKLLKDEDDHDDFEEANKLGQLDIKEELLQKSTRSRNINVLIVLIGQLQRQLKKKDAELVMLKRKKAEEDNAKEERIQELEKLNDALEDANETKDKELQKSANMIRELQRQLKRKDDQLEMLKKKLDTEDEASETRIAELEKQKEDSEEANRAKDKELQKLQRQLKRKDGELDEKSQRIEELEKLNEELEDAKDDEVLKLKKLLKLKDDELQVLRKKKQDDEAEATKLKEELEARKNEVVKLKKEKDDEVSKTIKVEKKLSSSVAEVAEVKKELEECQRNSWAILPSTKFIPESLDAKDKYLSTRRPVPPTTFKYNNGFKSSCYVGNSHKLVDKMIVDRDYNVRLVDEGSSHSEWPPLPTITIWVGKGDEDFDRNNWWYLKTSHPEGGLTMLVYYEGNRSQISSFISDVISLPFSKGIREVYSYTHKFSLFRMDPFGVRFGFAYRPK
ncbi:hypothetical protein LINGRAHAP2_LOCUS8996 [Linum grandiflorum]